MNRIILAALTYGVALASAVPGTDRPPLETLQDSEDAISSRSEGSLEETLIQYMKEYGSSFVLPFGGSTVTFDARNLDDEVLDLQLKFGSGAEEQARKKSKLKKIFVPILIIILLKAITLIPLGLSVLAIKTWNAIQLSFISFVSALAFAVWKICSKVNHVPHPPIIHDAWDPHHHDRYDTQQIPYSAYAQPNSVRK